MNRTCFILLACITASFVSLHAQNGSSIRSRYGIGELNFLSTPRQLGMGGVNIPFSSNYDISRSNPAAWHELTNVRLQMNGSMENLDNASTLGTTSTSAASLQGLSFALPIKKDIGMTAVLGFQPVSRSSFAIQARGDASGEGYRLAYESQGGLSALRIGMSYKPIPEIGVGAMYGYHFGTINQAWKVTFDNGSFHNTDQSRITSHSGSNLTFGAIFYPMQGLSFGATIATATDLNASRDTRYLYIYTDSTLVGESGTVELPMSFGFGASYLIGNKIMVAADFHSQDWAGAKAFDRDQPELKVAQRIGAGVEFLPSTEVGASFWEKTAWRLGFTSQALYVRLRDKEENEIAFTGGFGFPIGNYTRADLAVEYGWRGEESNLAGKDTFLRISFGISASELWFIRRGDDD